MAMRDITELMNAYRECSRNLWNVYFAKRENVGGSLDAFEQIRQLLFDSLVVSELSYEGEAEGPDEITLAFVDYFDFSQVPIKDFHYYLCKILSFPRHSDYEGREALLGVTDTKVFHDEAADQKQDTA